MKIIKLLVISSLMLPLLACEKEGPAERAGKKIDEAVENVKESAENTAEKLGDKAEVLGDKIEKKTD